MKRHFSILLILIFVFGLVHILGNVKYAKADSGACSWHNGVSCLAGPWINGKVMCNDGWVDSAVDYISVCNTSYSYESSINDLYETYQPTIPLTEKMEPIIGILPRRMQEVTNQELDKKYCENDTILLGGLYSAGKVSVAPLCGKKREKSLSQQALENIAKMQDETNQLLANRLEEEQKNEKIRQEADDKLMAEANKQVQQLWESINSQQKTSIIQCPANSYSVGNNQCHCNAGYVVSNNQCMLLSDWCTLTYPNSVATSNNTCNCPSNYRWNDGQTTCIKREIVIKNTEKQVNNKTDIKTVPKTLDIPKPDPNPKIKKNEVKTEEIKKVVNSELIVSDKNRVATTLNDNDQKNNREEVKKEMSDLQSQNSITDRSNKITIKNVIKSLGSFLKKIKFW